MEDSRDEGMRRGNGCREEGVKWCMSGGMEE